MEFAVPLRLVDSIVPNSPHVPPKRHSIQHYGTWLHPRPGCISMLWTLIPNGTLLNGRQLPTEGGRFGARFNAIINFQSVWSKNVSLITIDIMQQGYPRTPVGIVLNRSYSTQYTNFVPTKIDHSVLLLVTSTSMPTSNFTLVVSPTLFSLRTQQVFSLA